MKRSISDAFEVLARKAGVEIHEIDAKKICPKESVRLKCQVPLCEKKTGSFEICDEVTRDHKNA